MPSLKTHHLAIVWGGITFGVVSTVIYPQARGNASLERQLNDLTVMIAEADAVVEQVEVLSDWVVQIRSSVESSTRAIPFESDVSGLVRDLSLEMARIGIEHREITTSASIETEHARVLPITISMTTSFPIITQVIGWVEDLPRLVRLRRVKISTSSSSRQSFEYVTAEILLDAYFEPTQTQAGQDLTQLIAERLGEETQ